MLYEGIKSNSTIVLVPSTTLETMQLGGITKVTALSNELSQERHKKEKKYEVEKWNEDHIIISDLLV